MQFFLRKPADGLGKLNHANGVRSGGSGCRRVLQGHAPLGKFEWYGFDSPSGLCCGGCLFVRLFVGFLELFHAVCVFLDCAKAV